MALFDLFTPAPKKLIPMILEDTKKLFPECNANSMAMLTYQLLVCECYQPTKSVATLIEMGILNRGQVDDMKETFGDVDRNALSRILIQENTPNLSIFHASLINNGIAIPQ